jgi:mycothiol synthase
VIVQQQCTVRAATLEDAQPIADLVNAVDLVEIGAAEYSLDEVREDLRATGADIARNSWLAFDGDQLVSYGALWNEYGNERIDIDHYVRADAHPAGARLIDLMTARAAEVAAENGADEAVIHLHLPPGSAMAGAVLPALGWTVVRRHHVLKRPVSVAADPVPAAPSGVSLRTAKSDADHRIVYELLQDAFSAHFDHHPESYDGWRQRTGADELDWSLVWIATLDGTDIGALLGRNNRETMGWVRSIGVLAAARGRGIGTFLLRIAYAEFARRGRDTVGLGVDTQNATGALRLYEGLGMTLHFAADNWEIRVPAAGLAEQAG